MKLKPGRYITNSRKQTEENLRDNQDAYVSDLLTKKQIGSHGVRRGGKVVVVPQPKK